MSEENEKKYESWFIHYKSSIQQVERKLAYLAMHWYDARDSAIPRDIELDTDSQVAIRTLKKLTDDVEKWVELFNPSNTDKERGSGGKN
jgi:hypothetical protein